MGVSERCSLRKMAPTRLALPAAFLLLSCIVATTARSQPRQARQDGEETTTSSQVTSTTTTTTTKEEMMEEANEVMDPMEQCGKCKKAAYTYKKKFFCQKCVKEGHIKEADTVVNCSKCRKPRYRAHNGDFCGQECPNTSAGGMKDVDDKATSNDVVEPTVVTAVVDEDDTPDLGVLGNIFKFLVQTNTWGEVPANIPQAQSPAAAAASGETEEEEEEVEE